MVRIQWFFHIFCGARLFAIGPVYLSPNASSRFKELIELSERKEINLVKRRSESFPHFCHHSLSPLPNATFPSLSLAADSFCLVALTQHRFVYLCLCLMLILWYGHSVFRQRNSLNAGKPKLSTSTHYNLLKFGFIIALYAFSLKSKYLLSKISFAPVSTVLPMCSDLVLKNSQFRMFTIIFEINIQIFRLCSTVNYR